MADLVGFGVAIATGMQYLENFPERCYKSMLIPIMLEDKRAGIAKLKLGSWHVCGSINLFHCNTFFSVNTKLFSNFTLLRTGESAGKGFYLYDEKRRARPDPEVKKYIEKSRSIAGITPNPEVASYTLSPNVAFF